MTFKYKEVYDFCKEKSIYSIKDQAKAFNMGTLGYCCAICCHPCKLGRDIIIYIKETYGLKVLKRLVEKESTETWPRNEKAPQIA